MTLNLGQRIVLVIGWGLVLATVASTAAVELDPALGEDDWFNYAPNQGVMMTGSSGAGWGRAVIWIVAVVLWVVGSLLLLRSDRASSTS